MQHTVAGSFNPSGEGVGHREVFIRVEQRDARWSFIMDALQFLQHSHPALMGGLLQPLLIGGISGFPFQALFPEVSRAVGHDELIRVGYPVGAN